MKIQLSDHFTYKRLLCFVISPILMIICSSLYSIVDGFFVSNFVGKTPFAAINLIMPVIMAISTIGFMIGTGGSAVVSITLGEKNPELANKYFSMLVYTAIGIGLILSIIGFIFIRPISILLGADNELLNDCILYGRILFIGQTAFILQNVFQSLLITAEKPTLSLKVSVAAGVTNIVFDFLFIVVFKWGLAGAAIATIMGQFVGGFLPLIYFAKPNSSLLRLTKTAFYGKTLIQTCINGSSEMVTNLSVSIVSILFNFQLMRIAGENGVAAYGIIMYVNFIFMGVFMGYSLGSAPIISYHFGAENYGELKNLFRKSLTLMCGFGIILTVFAELLARPLVMIFASYDMELFTMTCRGFMLYALAFLFMGINVWGSAFFTALNNGLISATISFLRTLAFQIILIFVLPVLWGIDGIWLSVVFAEIFSMIITIGFFIAKRKKYKYV